jgi:hypothetical protein
MQIGQDAKLARFVLPLVELCRIEGGDGDAVEEGYPGEGRRGRMFGISNRPLNRPAIAVSRFSPSMILSR